MNLVDALATHARERPGHPAVIDGDSVVTYRDYHRLVLGAATRLRGLGVEAGRLVGVSLRDSIAHLVMLHALARIGAVIHPIDRALAAEEKARIARGLGTGLALIEPDGREIEGVEPCSIDESWLRAEAVNAGWTPLDRESDPPLILATSSGTTGVPKAAMVTHLQQWHRFMAVAGSVGLGADDRYLSIIEIKHNIGRSTCMAALHFGGTVVINRETESIARLVEYVERRQITLLYLLPTQLRQLIAHGRNRAPVFPSLRRLLVSSGTTTPEERRLGRELLTPRLYDVYGIVEAGFLSVAGPEDEAAHPDSVGRTVAGIDAQIVDEDGRPVAPGTTGEIGIRGPAMSREYFRNPEATARAFRRGWFYPGDVATIDGDGYIVLKGRKDDVINFSGLKIQPVDIEAALLAHPAVVEAAALGVDLPAVQQAPVAFVVLREDVAEADLIAFCRQRLASFKVPRRIYKIKQMPKNAMGKIVKTRLRELVSATMARTSARPSAS